MADIDHFREALQAEADRVSFERAKKIAAERYQMEKEEQTK